jgi:hypothetical protein
MRSKRALLAILLTCLLAGCHSACFQTAKIRQGTNTYLGVTKVQDNGTDEVSDYSVFVKGEIGHEATPEGFGYSFGLTFVSPLSKEQRKTPSSPDKDIESYPNEYVGILPEVKFQFRRVLPVDMAVGARLFAIYPNRATFYLSKDLGRSATVYANYSLDAVGHLVHTGLEVNLTPKVSVFAEYSAWLSKHEYPSDCLGCVKAYPQSFGLCFSYHILRD